MPSDAFLSVVAAALKDPATVDLWPADAAEVVEGREKLYVEILRKMRTNGGISMVRFAEELDRRQMYADAEAAVSIDISGPKPTKAAIVAAWKSLRAAHPEPTKQPPRAGVQGGDSGDLLNAKRLVEYARGRFVVAHGGAWFHWDGKRWSKDSAAAVHELAAKVARSWWKDAGEAASREAQDMMIKHARAAQKSGAIEAMISLAGKCFPDLKVDPKDFDTADWLLTVENGTIDLRTGELRPHDPGDRITKLAPVTYDPDAQAPRWERFLTEVLPSPGVRSYVQRAAGLSLTGIVRDHCFFMAVGAGRNGKGVLMRSIARVLGEYAVTAPMDLLIAKSGADHPAELAILEGARFVVASELPRGRWNEARLKQLTGGDAVPARGMRENFREMRPTWKLWIATNERPHAVGNGDALWERLKEIRFPVQFRDADDPLPERQAWPVKDPTTEETLCGELPGILRWCVEGCVAWARDGLREPKDIREATAEYRATEDVLGPFLSENPIAGPTKLRDLFAKWTEYAKGVNEQPGRLKDFGQAMRSRGYEVRNGAKNVTHVYPQQVILKMPMNTTLAPQPGGASEVKELTSDREIPLDTHSEAIFSKSYGNRLTEVNLLTRDDSTLSRDPGEDDDSEPAGWAS